MNNEIVFIYKLTNRKFVRRILRCYNSSLFLQILPLMKRLNFGLVCEKLETPFILIRFYL